MFNVVETLETNNEEIFINDDNKNMYDIIDDYLIEINENNEQINKLMKKIYKEVINE